MKDFMIWIPTQIFFGRTALEHLEEGVKKYGQRVMLVYGGGSVKRMGLYDQVVNILDAAGIFHCEFSGVEPNPKISHVRKGIVLARENKVDMVLALGGGSAIDTAKGIAGGFYYDGDVWDLAGTVLQHKILPVLTISTLSAAGTEMSTGGNWTNDDITPHVKLGFNCPDLRPRITYLNPEFTFSVPQRQTAAGVVDVMSHIFESYFSNVQDAYIQVSTAEGMLRCLLKYGPIAYREPDNYEARANIMYCAAWGNNGLIVKGNQTNWSVHILEHELTAYNDTVHGEGLAILTPHWMRFALNQNNMYRFVELAENVYGVDKSLPDEEKAQLAITKTEEFFKSLNMPTTLREVGIPEEAIEMFGDQLAKKSKYLSESFVPITREDAVNIFKAAY